MPSSEFFGYTLTNLGPLTTTFTAPSACATKSDNLVWYSRYDATLTAGIGRDRYLGKESCGNGSTRDDCIPSGEAIHKMVSASPSASNIWYHSPGISCPSGWTTAGTLKGGAEPTGSGIFVQEAIKMWTNESAYQVILLPQLFANALDTDEIMAMCCPSGWVAEPLGGSCSSSIGNLGSVSKSTACNVYWTGLDVDDVYVTSYAGKTWDPPLRSQDPITEEAITSTRTLANTGTGTFYNADNVYLATQTGGVIMVYKEAELNASKGDDGKGAGAVTKVGIVLPMLSVALSLFLGSGLAL
ncbi:unnamed protein product [Clonostachys byssicola]|uniref:Uncharacterized protein n=1 Tax=Clonostachys byssicola TaxID=160290 RepID=A0A9N9Y3Y8_9HYPO|nr:unnamed protein product [Clonostachys byssicola]